MNGGKGQRIQGFSSFRYLFYLQPFFIPLIRREIVQRQLREPKEEKKNRIVLLITTTMLFLFLFNLFVLLVIDGYVKKDSVEKLVFQDFRHG